jgi:hypothetical protein
MEKECNPSSLHPDIGNKEPNPSSLHPVMKRLL